MDDGRITAVDERPLDVLRWVVCQVDLSECETIDSVYDAVRLAFERELDSADGRILALRLVLGGRSAIHAQLFNRMAQWTEEFRGLSAGLGGIWIEKVVFRTTRKVSLEEIAGENTPIAGLLESIDSLELDGDRIMDVIPELSALKSKLPPDIQSIEESFLDTSSEKIAQLRTEVKELLIAKLLQREGTG